VAVPGGLQLKKTPHRYKTLSTPDRFAKKTVILPQESIRPLGRLSAESAFLPLSIHCLCQVADMEFFVASLPVGSAGLRGSVFEEKSYVWDLW